MVDVCSRPDSCDVRCTTAMQLPCADGGDDDDEKEEEEEEEDTCYTRDLCQAACIHMRPASRCTRAWASRHAAWPSTNKDVLVAAGIRTVQAYTACCCTVAGQHIHRRQGCMWKGGTGTGSAAVRGPWGLARAMACAS